MKAAWYEKQGPAREVLVVGEMPDPSPATGEVRICIAASDINPGDIWQMVFKNIRLFFLGSDDFPKEEIASSARFKCCA